MSDLTNILLVVGIAGCTAAAAWALMSHKKKGKAIATVRRIEEQEKNLTEDEKKLKRKLEDKKAILAQMRQHLSNVDKDYDYLSGDLGKVFRIIDDQLKLLKDATKIDKKDLKYLSHIELDIAGKKSRSHVSEFAHHIEAHFGTKIDEPGVARTVLDNIDETTPDSILRGVKRLAFYLVVLHYDFNKLKSLFDAQKKTVEDMVKVVKKIKPLAKNDSKEFKKGLQAFSNALTRLTSSTITEDKEYTIIFQNTQYVRKYLEQLDQNEAAQIHMEGPFLVVEGHNVSIVVSKESNGQQVFGKGEQIDVGYLPYKFNMWNQPNDKDCYIVLGDGEKLFFVRKKNVCNVLPSKGSEDKIHIERKGKQLLWNKHVKLQDKDLIVFDSDYRLRFLD